MPYESLLKEAYQHRIYTIEMPMPRRMRGLYADKLICINKNQPTVDKVCTLAEELGHYHTSDGNIIDQKDVRNSKQELIARQWAYNKLVPFPLIIEAHKARISGRHEVAEFMNVAEWFLQAAIDRYKDKYGNIYHYNERYKICLDPLNVIEMF